MNAPSFEQLLALYNQLREDQSFTRHKQHWLFNEKGHVRSNLAGIPFKLSYHICRLDAYNTDVTFILESRALKIVYKAEQTILTILEKYDLGTKGYPVVVGSAEYILRLHHHHVRLKRRNEGEDELMRLILSWPEA
jgi:hypothetical protein